MKNTEITNSKEYEEQVIDDIAQIFVTLAKDLLQEKRRKKKPKS